MKTKRLFVVFLSVFLVLTLSVFAFACTRNKEKDPTALTIDSKTEVTIEVGETYTLLYTCNGTVKVTASGGTYDEESHKFSADTAGAYTLVVAGTEEGKAETKKTVTITVVAGPDKSAITTAIQSTSSLIASDYTSTSWAALSSAKAEANGLINKHGVTQEDVTAAVKGIEDAVKALVPAQIAKVTVAEDKFTVDGTNYFAEDYENYAEVTAKIEALNGNAEVKLNSDYTAKLNAILAELSANPVLNVSGAPDGLMLVSELVPYQMTATADAGATIEWKLNGTKVGDGATYTYTPAAFGETFEIEVKSTVGEGANAKVKTLTYSGKIIQTAYTVDSSLAQKVSVDKNVISTEQVGWGDAKGRKVVLSDVVFSGNVTVYFDVMFEEKGSPAVLGIFFLDANGNDISNWAVVNGNEGFIEVATEDDNAKKVRISSETTANNVTYHIKATRSIVDGKGYLSMWLLDDNGRVITENLGNNIAKNYIGAVKIGIQSENTKGKISNIRVANGTEIIDKSALGEAIRTYDTLANPESDYTEETLNAYKTKLATANAVYNSANSTQASIETATTELTAAHAALAFKAVVYLEIADGSTSFEFKGTTYNEANYKNFAEVVADIKALTGYTAQSVYEAKVAELVATLEEVAGLTLTSSVPAGKYFVQQLPASVTFTAAVADGTTVTWKLNGAAVTEGVSADGLTYTYTPVNGEYKVEAVATFGAAESTQAIEGGFYITNYAVHQNYTDKISVENSIIDVHEGGTGWDPEKGRKVVLKDLNVHGEFVLTLDVKFKTNAIMGLFLLTQDGVNVNNDDNRSHYIVINNGSKFMGIGINQGGGEPHYDIPEGVVGNDQTFTLKITRSLVDGKWHLKGEVINAEGAVVATGDREGCTGDNVTLGIQSENGTFTVSNIKLKSGIVIDRKIMSAAKANCDEIDKTISSDKDKLALNFSDAEKIAAYSKARQEIFDAYYTPDCTPERIKTAVEAFKTAYAALLEVKVDPSTAFAVIAEGEKTFTYNGVEYKDFYYTNYEDVLARIKTLNAANYTYVTEYQAAVEPVIAELNLALKVGITLSDGTNEIANNNVVVNATATEYTFTASGDVAGVESATFTYAWKVDGKAVDCTAATYAMAPTQGTHVVEVAVTYGEGATAMTVSQTFTVAFEKANINVHDRVTNNNDGTFTAQTGNGWGGDWEGRKVVFDELVFNGSFSAYMDIKFNEKVGGPNVVTLHFLNADTLSRNNGEDKAVVGYGCICLHENPVRLETGGNFGKKQSSDGGFEAVATEMAAAAALFEQGKTFTVRLDVYRTADEKISCDFSVYDSVNGKWITFARTNDWGGNFGGGFTVGVNIENAGVTLSNFRFELLEAGTRGDKNYIAGTVKSKADLYNKYVEYVNVKASDYVNGTEFVKAYNEAYDMLCNNQPDADYAGALAKLEAAYAALERRTVEVTVEGLDAGYTDFRGIDKLTATFAEGVTATDVKWTYDFLAADAEAGAEAVAKTVEGADLALAAGVYSNVRLSFGVGGETYTYVYQNFNVSVVTFKVDNRNTVNEDGSVNMVPIGWDNPLEQVVLTGVRPHELEFSVDVTYNGGNVMAFRLSERDVRMVVRFEAGQIGFDENGNDGYVSVNGGFTVGETYTFKIKAVKNNKLEYDVTFSVYKADGTKLAEKTRNSSVWRIARTEFNITSEHVTCKLDNFQVMYN